MADLDAIRRRHADAASLSALYRQGVIEVHDDRGVLLAEVDRLTAELAEGRAAYDALCRDVGNYALGERWTGFS